VHFLEAAAEVVGESDHSESDGLAEILKAAQDSDQVFQQAALRLGLKLAGKPFRRRSYRNCRAMAFLQREPFPTFHFIDVFMRTTRLHFRF
jgi:hypothetical protein